VSGVAVLKAHATMGWFAALLFLSLAATPSSSALSDRVTGSSGLRVAIVISNQRYEHLPATIHTRESGDKVEAALKAVNFDIVVPIEDFTENSLVATLDDIRRRVGDRKVATIFLYYTGHAGTISERGDTYLLPVEFQPQPEAPIEGRAYSLSRVIAILSAWNPTSIVFAIDACRTSSALGFGREAVVDNKGQKPSGLGAGHATTFNSRLYISFSTAPGTPAKDDSVYAEELSRQLAVRGQDVATLFAQVATAVETKTDPPQQPFVEGDPGAGRSIYLQPLYPVELIVTPQRRLSPPKAFYKPQSALADDGSVLWFQSGYWSIDHPARWQITGGQQSFTLGEPKDRMVIDIVREIPGGGWFVGGHDEPNDQPKENWTPFVLELSAVGEVRRKITFAPALPTGPNKVSAITVDPFGLVFVAVTVVGGGPVIIAYVNPQQTVARVPEVVSAGRGTFEIYGLRAFSEREMAERDCMLRPKPCAPMVLAAATITFANYEKGALVVELGPRGLAPGMPLSASGANFVVNWIGASPCCQLAGAKETGGKNAFLFVQTNELGFPDPNATIFLPPEEHDCSGYSAVELPEGGYISLGVCDKPNEFVGTSYAVRVGPDSRVMGFARLCGKLTNCDAVGIVRAKDGTVLVAVSDPDTRNVNGILIEKVQIQSRSLSEQ